MECIGPFLLLVIGWFIYRVFISGSGGSRSFVQYYKDQNETRDKLQRSGGIHNVEQTNINDLEQVEYEVKEYGENFVSLSRLDKYGSSEVSIVHGKNRKSMELTFESRSRESNEINLQRPVRSSNGALSTLEEMVSDTLTRGNVDSKDDMRRHFAHLLGDTSGEPELMTTFLIDGYRFSFSPLHKKMSVSRHVTLEKFSSWCRVLSEDDVRTLRNGEMVTLENVRLGSINKNNRKYTFDIIATEETDVLNSYIFSENKTLYINYDILYAADLSCPAFYDNSDDPLYELVKNKVPDMPERDVQVGERFTVTLFLGAYGLVVHKFK